ncbi:MAG TPA: SET domain-containing protein-lysine N-methyltransferase [Gemmatimonadaceae bacterium]|nr:SET domain-containing protein-lysine N-methyltransferase [Gemmatimonadaceae bacterium]
MIHPQTELRRTDRAIGYGVVATARIPRGTITWVHDPLDRRFDSPSVARMPALLRSALERYCYRELDGAYVLCWDHARFNNHSCRPSCRTVGDFDIAVRDIDAGEELTIEYATINVLESFDCRCGAPDCRGAVRPDDARELGARWDREILDAARLTPSVAQPLEALFELSPTLAAMYADSRGGRDIVLPRSRDLVIGGAAA